MTVNQSKYYAGIGSRETPPDICIQMTNIAKWLNTQGWILRSGGAEGADKAFELGAGKQKQIFTPNDVSEAALKLAAQYHPNWNRCSMYAKKLLARNGYQILGRMLNAPSKFVVCWTKDGKTSGGTGQALRIAMDQNIPIFNLYHSNADYDMKKFVEDFDKTT